MPYTIQKNDKEEHCVHVKNADGSVGKKIACHETRQGAVDQIGAIESEEKPKSGKKSIYGHALPVQVAFSPHTGEWKFAPALSEWPVTDDASTHSINYPTEEKNMDDTEKGMSLDQLRYKISDAWEDEYGRSLGVWVSEVFHEDGFIIASDYGSGTHFKVSYALADEEVSFSPKTEWQEVKLKKEWVEKSLSLRDRMNFKDFIIDEDSNEIEIDPRYTVKTLGEKRLGGYGILWGDEQNKDLHGEWFDQETTDIKAIFDAMGKIPLIVHHGNDDEVKTFVYGEVDVMQEDDTGLWWEGKIKEFEVYKEYVQPLLERQAMFSSTGTLPAAKRRTKSGHITRWPVAEMTTTWIPAEWRMLERPVDEIKSAYKAIDLNCDLSEYDEEQEQDQGAEKARLQALVQYHLSELDLLEVEI